MYCKNFFFLVFCFVIQYSPVWTMQYINTIVTTRENSLEKNRKNTKFKPDRQLSFQVKSKINRLGGSSRNIFSFAPSQRNTKNTFVSVKSVLSLEKNQPSLRPINNKQTSQLHLLIDKHYCADNKLDSSEFEIEEEIIDTEKLSRYFSHEKCKESLKKKKSEVQKMEKKIISYAKGNYFQHQEVENIQWNYININKQNKFISSVFGFENRLGSRLSLISITIDQSEFSPLCSNEPCANHQNCITNLQIEDAKKLLLEKLLLAVPKNNQAFFLQTEKQQNFNHSEHFSDSWWKNLLHRLKKVEIIIKHMDIKITITYIGVGCALFTIYKTNPDFFGKLKFNQKGFFDDVEKILEGVAFITQTFYVYRTDT